MACKQDINGIVNAVKKTLEGPLIKSQSQVFAKFQEIETLLLDLHSQSSEHTYDRQLNLII